MSRPLLPCQTCTTTVLHQLQRNWLFQISVRPAAVSTKSHIYIPLPIIFKSRSHSHLDWALLDKSLRFLTVDPALAYHLGIGLPNFLEAKLLDFVHPEERESARSDLGSVLEERTLHGSVTR